MKRASETFFPTTTATAATAAAAAAARWKRGVAASGRLSARAVELRRFAFGSKEARNIKSLFEAPLDAEQRGTGEARQCSELQYPACTSLPGRKNNSGRKVPLRRPLARAAGAFFSSRVWPDFGIISADKAQTLNKKMPF